MTSRFSLATPHFQLNAPKYKEKRTIYSRKGNGKAVCRLGNASARILIL